MSGAIALLVPLNHMYIGIARHDNGINHFVLKVFRDWTEGPHPEAAGNGFFTFGEPCGQLFSVAEDGFGVFKRDDAFGGEL